jgi:hypothetical protein
MQINRRKVVTWIKKNKTNLLLGISAGIITPSIVFILVKYLESPENVPVKQQKTIQGLLKDFTVKADFLQAKENKQDIVEPSVSNTEEIQALPSIKFPAIDISKYYTKKTLQKPAAHFTQEQRNNIVKFLENKQDYTGYVSSIIGRRFKRSTLKLYRNDPIPVYLHLIEGTAFKYPRADIVQGIKKLRTISKTVKMPMIKQ